MNSPDNDSELGMFFRKKAAELGQSPLTLLKMAEAAALWHKWSVMPNFPPFPKEVESLVLSEVHLADWPEWSASLITPGCRIERLTWPNGTVSVRLLSPRGLVLAANILHPGDPG